jgi:polysaccharide export outer membrane protein
MSGNVLADMRLRRNDIIFVPEPKEEFVSVLGEVTRPGTIPLTPASTLTSVLSEAGCCSEGGGFSPKIHIIQPSTGKQFDISYKQLMTVAGQQEYTLHSGDVILIPKSGFFKATYVFQRVSPVTSLVGLASVALF